MKEPPSQMQGNEEHTGTGSAFLPFAVCSERKSNKQATLFFFYVMNE